MNFNQIITRFFILLYFSEVADIKKYFRLGFQTILFSIVCLLGAQAEHTKHNLTFEQFDEIIADLKPKIPVSFDFELAR